MYIQRLVGDGGSAQVSNEVAEVYSKEGGGRLGTLGCKGGIPECERGGRGEAVGAKRGRKEMGPWARQFFRARELEMSGMGA